MVGVCGLSLLKMTTNCYEACTDDEVMLSVYGTDRVENTEEFSSGMKQPGLGVSFN